MKIKKILIALTLALTLSLAACNILKRGSDLKGTAWSLIEINGQPILEGSAPTLIFEADRAGGNASCNTFGGEYMAKDGKLSFGPIASTLMYCEDVMDQETAFLAALERAEGYLIKAGDLLILGPGGDLMLVFGPLK
jgi:putative lipoprotein